MTKRKLITALLIGATCAGLYAFSVHINTEDYVQETAPQVEPLPEKTELEKKSEEIGRFSELLASTTEQLNSYTVLEFELEQQLLAVRLGKKELETQQADIENDIDILTGELKEIAKN